MQGVDCSKITPADVPDFVFQKRRLLLHFLHFYKGTSLYEINVWCPACNTCHGFRLQVYPGHQNDVWQWNGDWRKPTFRASMGYNLTSSKYRNPERFACHSYLTDGVWNYLDDSTHPLAGQKAEIGVFPDNFHYEWDGSPRPHSTN